MRSFTKHKNNKKLAVLTLVVAGVAVLGVVYLLIAKPFAHTPAGQTELRPSNEINYSPATPQEKKDSDQAKTNIVNQDTSPTNTSQTIAVTISRASQVGQAVSVRTFVTGATAGECNLTFTQGAQTISKHIPIALDANSYICNTDIAIDEFAASGDWNLTVVAKSGNSTSPAAKQTVTITK